MDRSPGSKKDENYLQVCSWLLLSIRNVNNIQIINYHKNPQLKSQYKLNTYATGGHTPPSTKNNWWRQAGIKKMQYQTFVLISQQYLLTIFWSLFFLGIPLILLFYLNWPLFSSQNEIITFLPTDIMILFCVGEK